MKTLLHDYGDTLSGAMMPVMRPDPENEIPRFAFIRKLCPELDDEGLRRADEAFFAYVELVKSICDDLGAKADSPTQPDSADRRSHGRV